MVITKYFITDLFIIKNMRSYRIAIGYPIGAIAIHN